MVRSKLKLFWRHVSGNRFYGRSSSLAESPANRVANLAGPVTACELSARQALFNRFSHVMNVLKSKGLADQPCITYHTKYCLKTDKLLHGAEVRVLFKDNNVEVVGRSHGAFDERAAYAQAVQDVLLTLEKERGLNERAINRLKKQKLQSKPAGLNASWKVNDYFARHKKSLSISYRRILVEKSTPQWEATISISWPLQLEITQAATNKKSARNKIYEKLLQILDEKGFMKGGGISAKPSPSLSYGDDVVISDKCRSMIDSVIDQNKRLQKALFLHDDDNASASEASASDDVITDILTGLPLEEAKDENNRELNNFWLMSRLKQFDSVQGNAQVEKIRYQRRNLPIYSHRDLIVNTIANNRVTLIKGETGCGKTTQLPQYIFENAIESGQGSSCNIIVTQPRRLSVASVAHRIASERFENIGDTVGYRMRLKYVRPRGNGSMLFITPAMLLRARLSNLNFRGVSHVIVDEIHERDIWTDFLLICLRRIMKTNPDLKVVLMSATFGVEKFKEYFNDCPVLEISGRTFPVAEYFLEDLENDARSFDNANLARALKNFANSDLFSENSTKSDNRIPTDLHLMHGILAHIHRTKEPGAILCFLPTISDIRKLSRMMTENPIDNTVVLPCHSQLSIEQQQRVFSNFGDKTRKIVLATNVAETSITIDDVKHVVNVGVQKSQIVDGEKRCIRDVEFWASKASQIQRRGRAGRTSPGFCYHLFPKHHWSQLPENAAPELMTNELTSVILLSKLLNPGEDPAEFLGEAVDAPSPSNLESAVEELIEYGFLDTNRNITTMGKCVAGIGCSISFAKSLLYSVILKCADPILSITSLMSVSRDIFDEVDENIAIPMNAKDRLSDHVMLARLYDSMRNSTEGQSIEPVNGLVLNESSFRQAMNLRYLFAKQLKESGLVENDGDLLDLNSPNNAFASNDNFALAALMAGCHRNLYRLRFPVFSVNNPQFSIKHWNFSLLDCEKRKVFQYKSPVLRTVASTTPRNDKDYVRILWFTNFDKILNFDGRTFRTDELSLISLKSCLLFSGFKLEPYGQSSLLLSPSQDFIARFESVEDRDRFVELRSCVDNLAQWICSGSFNRNHQLSEQFDSFYTDLLLTLNAVLDEK